MLAFCMITAIAYPILYTDSTNTVNAISNNSINLQDYSTKSTFSISTQVLDLELQNAQDITIDENKIFIVDNDTLGGNLIECDLSTLDHTTTALTDVDESSILAKSIAVNYSGNLAISSSNVNSVYVSTSTNWTDATSFTRYFANTDSQIGNSFGQIVDIAITLNGDIYLLDSTGKILQKTAESNRFIEYCDLSTFSIQIDEQSRISIGLDGNKLVISSGTNIYDITQTSAVISTNFAIPMISDNIQDILIDHTNCLYVLTSGQQSQIIKCNDQEYQSITLPEQCNNATAFCINADNGDTYILTPTAIIRATVSDGFFNSLQDETIPVDINTYSPDSPLQVLKLTSDATVYNYANYLVTLGTLIAGDEVVLLDSQNEEFYFVLITNMGENNVTGFIKKSCAGIVSTTPAREQCRLILNSANIYAIPSSLPNTSATAPRIVDTISKLDQNNEYTIVTPIDSAILPKDSNNITFVPITYNDNGEQKFGYIDSNLIIEASQTTLDDAFVTNATTRGDIEVYSDDTLSTVLTELSKGTKVNVVSINNDVCQIEWQIDGVTMTGYVSHKYIDDGKFSNLQIVGLSVMCIAIVCAILMIVSIHYRKKKAQQINSDLE